MPTLVTVASYTNPWDAHVACGLLESEGVRAWLAGEHHVWVNWPLSQALGGVKLQVSTEDQAAALDILRAMQDGEFETALQAECGMQPDACQNCGSLDFQARLSKNLIALNVVTTLWVAVPFSAAMAGKVCRRCGTAATA